MVCVCSKGRIAKTFLVVVSCISSFLVWYHRVIPSILFDEISVAMKAKETEMGYIGATFFIGYSVIQPLVPLLTSHISPAIVLGLSTIVSAIGSCLFGYSKSFTMACLSRFIIGVGCGPVTETLNTVLYRWFNIRIFTTLQGLMLVCGAFGGMFVQGPLYSIVDQSEWRISFYAIAAVGIAIGLLHIIMRSKEDCDGTVSLDIVGGNDSVAGQSSTVEDMMPKPFEWAMLKTKNFWGVIIYMSFVSAVFFNFCSAWAGPYLMHYYAYSNSESGYLQTTLILGFIVGVFAFGFLVDLVWKRRIILIIANVLALVLIIEFIFLKVENSNVLLFTAMFFFGLATMGPVPIAVSILMGIDPTGVILSTANMSMNLVTGLLHLVVSAVINSMHGEEARDINGKEFQCGLWIPSAVCIGVSFVGLFLLDECPVPEPE